MCNFLCAQYVSIQEEDKGIVLSSVERRKCMTTSERATVVGVFTDAAQAEQAIDELGRVGFSDDEVSVSKGGAESGGFIDRVKGLFTGQATATLTTADDFMRIGVASQDAAFYQSEVE